MRFGVSAFLRLDDLIADDGGGGVVSSHLVEHEMLDGAVDLLSPEHAVVQRGRHRLGDKLQHVQVRQLGGVDQSATFSLEGTS